MQIRWERWTGSRLCRLRSNAGLAASPSAPASDEQQDAGEVIETLAQIAWRAGGGDARLP
jgi:hypothetical protein